VAVLLNWVTISKSETICIQDIPNPGDSTCTSTYSTGTAATTNNIISQTFNDGSWNGTMFPDSSDLNEANVLTGKHGKFAETTVSSNDLLTEAEIQQGFTSNFNAEIRWWNKEESTVTMYQHATNGTDTISQSITLTDTTNHNYQYNDYGNTLIVGPNADNTHGTLTAGFSFDIQGNINYNGGHAGVDVTDPTLTIDYTALTSATSTTIEYCWQKNPPTCPGQDEIEEVTNIIEDFEDNFELIFEDIETIAIDVPDDLIMPDFQWEAEEIIVDEPTLELELFSVETVDMMPDMDTVEIMSIPIDMPIPEPELVNEPLNTEEMIDAYDPEPTMEVTIQDEPTTTEPVAESIEVVAEPEAMAMAEETMSVSEEPTVPVSETIEEEIVQEESIEEEEIIEEETIVETQTEEEAAEPVEEDIAVAAVEEEPETVEAEVNEDQPEVNIDVAKIEKFIDGKVKSQVEKVEATLVVVNELVSRAMIANQADLSSYATMNAALFDNRELPDGNPDFFNQVVLAGYDRTIYNNQVSLGANDPITNHNIELKKASDASLKAYLIYKEKLNELNGV
tara:strand:- start:8529 stop:10223 length:1695 start_codon:yes stop_codon:yes gene_type:complete